MAIPSGVVMTKFFAPMLVPVGAVRVIEVDELTVKLVTAIPSIVTDVVPEKLVPITVTNVPPERGPTEGDTDVIVGAPTHTAYIVALAAKR